MFIDPKGVKPSRETEFSNALCELAKDRKQPVDSGPKARRSRFKLPVLLLAVAILLYPLSMVPVGAAVKALPPRSPSYLFAAEQYHTIYSPIFWVRDHAPFRAAFDAYLDLWGAK
jgi:hypothetical protein